MAFAYEREKGFPLHAKQNCEAPTGLRPVWRLKLDEEVAQPPWSRQSELAQGKGPGFSDTGSFRRSWRQLYQRAGSFRLDQGSWIGHSCRRDALTGNGGATL